MDIVIDDREFVNAIKDTLENHVKNATNFHFYWEIFVIKNITAPMIVPMLVNAIIELDNVNVMNFEMEMIVLSFSVVDKSIVKNVISSNASNVGMVTV